MKPMLAATIENMKDIKYPVYASPKLDGVRCLVTKEGKLVSRSLKPIPNKYVNKLFGRREYAGLDGELISGSPTAKDVYRRTVGDVRRADGEPDVTLFVFDEWNRQRPFRDAVDALDGMYHETPVLSLPQHLIKDEKELLKYEQDTLDLGYEGLILRDPDGLYKFGRSTMKEQGMMKLKRFVDGEAEILEVIEEMHNGNEAKKNELGRTARSSAKAGKVPTGRAGGLSVRDAKSGVEFTIGTGMDDADKKFFWKHRDATVGKLVKYKSFLIGVKDKPRFPVYLGPREKWDL